MHAHAQYLPKFKFSQSINQAIKNDKRQESEFSQNTLPFTCVNEVEIINKTSVYNYSCLAVRAK